MADIPDMPVAFRVERHCTFNGGMVELRRYLWSKPVEQTFQGIADALVLNMALTSRPGATRVERIGAQEALPSGEAGRLLIMMPGARYRLFAPTGAFQSLHCALDCSRFEALLGEPIEWETLGEMGGVLRPGTEIEWLLSRMGYELEHDRLGRDEAMDAYAGALFVELARRLRQETSREPELHRGGLAAWRMKVLFDRVHADRPAPGITELAELCALTPRQLSRAFKAETGMTLGRYVDEETMERAHRMLTDSDRSIAGIARELGFASADSFARSYRRITGSLPGQTRRHQARPSN